jgi:hypothetical protein
MGKHIQVGRRLLCPGTQRRSVVDFYKPFGGTFNLRLIGIKVDRTDFPENFCTLSGPFHYHFISLNTSHIVLLYITSCP